MITLTEGVESIGPHPARDISELEARANGYIKGPHKYSNKTIFRQTDDGRDNYFWATFQSVTTGGATEEELAATAARFYLAERAHDGLVEALERAREQVFAFILSETNSPKAALSNVAQIDAALNAAHGRK